MNSDTKNYEFAYLLTPSISEEEVSAVVAKLATIIQEQNGVIRRQEEARKRQLAYPIRKERLAYFGWITFSMTPELVTELKKKLAVETQILRHLLVEEDMTQFNLPPRRMYTPRPMVSAVKSPETPAEESPEEKLDLEALDKKLEEILGK
ncbi:MAG: 30S ribosomal protein S6 [Candidatus Sungbacteria bacterium]|nr:30S ribosomal protein S6 [Candidatus Sungbacteria bacterium]